MAEISVGLSEWEEGLFRAIQSYQPGIVISTLEEDRALNSILRVAQALQRGKMGERDVTSWSVGSWLKYSLVTPTNPNDRIPPQDLAGKNAPPPLEKRLKDWVEENGNSILICYDIEPVLERSYALVRIMREVLERVKFRGLRKTLVIINKEFRLPEELRSGFLRFALDVPTVGMLHEQIKTILNGLRTSHDGWADLALDEDLIRAFATGCSGLLASEARMLLSLALAKFKCLDERAVALAQREKARILLAGGALALQEPRAGFDHVGGLEHAKTWANGITPILKAPEEAKAYGLKIPSGLLLCGVSGTGKSLLAEALAHEWRLPLLRFDVGACFGSLVGESEKNIRRMIEMAQAIKPCVVFVDEIEKALGGDSLDGGTTSRVKQSLLTWLQDKPDSVFVVATANDLTRLEAMPELIRSGRFDQKFFVDLPNVQAREEILRIHFSRSGHIMDAKILRDAANKTPRYSGAEIEVIVQQSLRFAFGSKPRLEKPNREQVFQAIREVKPLADTMAESVSRLRAWCHDGRAKLAGGVLEQDALPSESADDFAKDLVN